MQEFKREAKQRLLRGLRQRLAADFRRAQLRLQLEQFFHIFEILRAETETLIVMAQNFRLFMLLAALQRHEHGLQDRAEGVERAQLVGRGERGCINMQPARLLGPAAQFRL